MGALDEPGIHLAERGGMVVISIRDGRQRVGACRYHYACGYTPLLRVELCDRREGVGMKQVFCFDIPEPAEPQPPIVENGTFVLVRRGVNDRRVGAVPGHTRNIRGNQITGERGAQIPIFRRRFIIYEGIIPFVIRGISVARAGIGAEAVREALQLPPFRARRVDPEGVDCGTVDQHQGTRCAVACYVARDEAVTGDCVIFFGNVSRTDPPIVVQPNAQIPCADRYQIRQAIPVGIEEELACKVIVIRPVLGVMDEGSAGEVIDIPCGPACGRQHYIRISVSIQVRKHYGLAFADIGRGEPWYGRNVTEMI